MNDYIEQLRCEIIEKKAKIRQLIKKLREMKKQIEQLEAENLQLQVYKSISENKDLLTEQIRKEFVQAIEEIKAFEGKQSLHKEEDLS